MKKYIYTIVLLNLSFGGLFISCDSGEPEHSEIDRESYDFNHDIVMIGDDLMNSHNNFSRSLLSNNVYSIEIQFKTLQEVTDKCNTQISELAPYPDGDKMKNALQELCDYYLQATEGSIPEMIEILQTDLRDLTEEQQEELATKITAFETDTSLLVDNIIREQEQLAKEKGWELL